MLAEYFREASPSLPSSFPKVVGDGKNERLGRQSLLNTFGKPWR